MHPTIGVRAGSTWCGLAVVIDGQAVDASTVGLEYATRGRRGPDAIRAFDEAVISRIDQLMRRHDQAAGDALRASRRPPTPGVPWQVVIRSVTLPEPPARPSQERAAAYAQARLLTYLYPDAVLVPAETDTSGIELPEGMRGPRPAGWSQHDGQALGLPRIDRRAEQDAYRIAMLADRAARAARASLAHQSK